MSEQRFKKVRVEVILTTRNGFERNPYRAVLYAVDEADNERELWTESFPTLSKADREAYWAAERFLEPKPVPRVVLNKTYER